VGAVPAHVPEAGLATAIRPAWTWGGPETVRYRVTAAPLVRSLRA
jgi:hypothetical protein